MENEIGVVNPNNLPNMQEFSPELFFFALASGVITGLIVTAVIVMIMKSAFRTRINTASVIASFSVAGFVFTVFIMILSFVSDKIWVVPSVIVWTVTMMLCLRLMQPPSLEQLIARTKKDVIKLEKINDKLKEKEAKKLAKKERKADKFRRKDSVESPNATDEIQ